MRLPQVLWDDAGRPTIPDTDPTPGVCCICGTPSTHTAPAKVGLGTGFSDYAILRRPDSERVCPACVWIMRGKPPATWRLWTVVWRQGWQAPESAGPAHGPATLLTNRGNVKPVLDLLLNPPDRPWAVSVAMSGQRHILPAAETCPPGTWAPYLEGVRVTGTPDLFRGLWGHLRALRAAGFTADEITTGVIGSQRITVDALTVWRQHYPHVTAHRTAPITALALWTITKETMHDRL